MHPLNILIESQRNQVRHTRPAAPRRRETEEAAVLASRPRRRRPMSAAYSVAILVASLIVFIALALV